MTFAAYVLAQRCYRAAHALSGVEAVEGFGITVMCAPEARPLTGNVIHRLHRLCRVAGTVSDTRGTAMARRV